VIGKSDKYRFGLSHAIARSSSDNRGEIAHVPWVLHPAQAEIFTNTVAQSHGIPLPDQPPLLHFVHRMDMVAWNVERLT
jgi:uncharacterized protein